MNCPKCESNNVNCSTSTYVRSKSRSFLWNLLMICCTGGLWILWILIRKKKEVVETTTMATCNGCGFSWKIK